MKRNSNPKPAFPAWYNRVRRISQHRYIQPTDYDIDISDLGEGEEGSSEEEDPDSDSPPSERSYGYGSVAERYYELKEERKERKRELLEVQKEKEKEIEWQRKQEVKVNNAYTVFKETEQQSMKEGKTIPLASIASKRFRLYSSEYVERFYSVGKSDPGCEVPNNRLEFYRLSAEDDDPTITRTEEERSKLVWVDVHIDDTDCQSGAIPLPTQASSDIVKVKTRTYQARHELQFHFFGDEFLKLTVPWDVILEGGCVSMSNPREVFEFVGIMIQPRGNLALFGQ